MSPVPEAQQLQENILPVSYTLVRRKGQKHINIRVHHDGRVTVSAPAHASMARVDKAVKIKQKWIHTHVERAKEKLTRFDELTELPLGGTTFRVVTEYDPTLKGHISLEENRRLILMRTGNRNRQPRMDALARFLKRYCSDVITPEVRSLSKSMKITVDKIFYRNQKTRWGSSSARGNISLNFRIALLPPDERSYLIIHELTHQIHMNHSDEFWKQLAGMCPGYLKSDRWLKEHSYYLGLFR